MSPTTPSKAGPVLGPNISKSGGNDAGNLNPWEQAWETLSEEDKQQYGAPSSSMLDILKSVQEVTQSKQKTCVEKGWTVYRNKNGEEVKLRHVLEKISVWVKEIIKIIDLGVSLDRSGHAALPWAIVKFVTETGFSSVDVFSKVVEGIESVSGLIARYTVVEKLYLHQQCESIGGFHEAITKLYAAILTYLSKVKAYCTGNTWKRLGRSLREAVSKQYDELQSKISETEVERWTHLVDVELQLAIRADASEHHRILRDTLIRLNKPIMQTSDQISMIWDKFERDERIRVLHWMSKIEYRNHHEDLSKGLLAQSGQWLLESKHFIEWGQSSVSSILWLHGIPGSGKTRLVSTVINTIIDATSSSSTSPTAFFYCVRSTAEPERAKPAEIMGTLLRQLASSQSDLSIKDPVVQEYEARNKMARGDYSALKKLTVEDCTRLIIELTKNHPATIILDALDECEKSTRHELFEAFDEIISKSAEVVKVFVSSRDDIDIKLHLEHSKNISIGVENNSGDIARFVKSEVDRLTSKQLLLDGNVPQKLKCKMIETLINGAQGMFRWVEMSLEALKRMELLRDFKHTLGKLPAELSGLYDIIHAQIDRTEPYGRELAIQTLTWLLCAQRLLSAKELIAAVYQVDDDMSSDSDEDSELEGEHITEKDILRLCRNLVVFDSTNKRFRFAHQSVREYLLKKPQYTLLEQHTLATERCLDVYLTEWLGSSVARKMKPQNEILKPYARLYWPVHYKHVENSKSSELARKISRFTGRIPGTSIPYVQWISEVRSSYGDLKYAWGLNRHLGLDSDDYLGSNILFVTSRPDTVLATASAFGIPSILQGDELLGSNSHPLLSFAAGAGHDQVVQLLLDKGVDVNAQSDTNKSALQEACSNGHDHIVYLLLGKGANVNARDMHGHTALQEACRYGHNGIVQLLLGKGADVNVQSRKDGNALQAASSRGHDQIVQMLLDRGADIHAQGGYYGNALQLASSEGHDQTVQILLNRGADIHAQGGRYGNALQLASFKGHDQIVQILLNRGADIHAQGGYYGNALQLASYYGHDQTVQILLNRGADINAQGGRYGNALQLASFKGHDQIVQMLLDRGADINAQGGEFGNALQAASARGHNEIVQMLLDRGADIHAQGGYYGNALQLASSEGHDQTVQILLNRGADIHAQGGRYGNALQLASFKGHDQIVQMLLDRGADINAQEGEFGNALQLASFKGHDQIVQMLLDRGADINAQGGAFGNALQAASYYGHDQTVQILLNRGVDINAQGGRYGNALQLASFKGHDQIVQMLLDRGADINAQGGEFGNALQAASYCGHGQIVQILLDRGADINTQGGLYGNALQAASARGHNQIVQILLDRGADINAQGEFGNALQAASYCGHNQTVQILLDRGADIHAQGGEYGNALQVASARGHNQIVQMLLNRGAKYDDDSMPPEEASSD